MRVVIKETGTVYVERSYCVEMPDNGIAKAKFVYECDTDLIASADEAGIRFKAPGVENNTFFALSLYIPSCEAIGNRQVHIDGAADPSDSEPIASFNCV
jgi:hypothetical protein